MPKRCESGLNCQNLATRWLVGFHMCTSHYAEYLHSMVPNDQGNRPFEAERRQLAAECQVLPTDQELSEAGEQIDRDAQRIGRNQLQEVMAARDKNLFD